MSSLDTLKRILHKNEPVDLVDSARPNGGSTESNGADLTNLARYLDTTTDRSGILLEKLRIDAVRDSKAIPSGIDSLSAPELDAVRSTIQNYQAELRGLKQRLQPTKKVLNHFSEELTELSSSLVALHEKSNMLSNSADVQREGSEKLNSIILDLMIPPDIANSVLKGRIDSEWLENLHFIDEKTQLIENLHNGSLDESLVALYKDSIAFQQLTSGIEMLTAKAIERIRDHIIVQIKLLRSSTSKSSQAVQADLIRVKEIFAFLKQHHPVLAAQLQLAYLYTMKWYYRSRFAKYLYALQKLNLRHIDATMVIGGISGTEEKSTILGGGLKWLYGGGSSGGSLHPSSATSPTPPINHTKITFSEYLVSVDKRIELLRRASQHRPQNSMPAQIAESTPFAYWLEFVFDQWNIAVIDNVIVEYLFVVEFFYQSDEKHHSVEIPHVPESGEPAVQSKDWSLLVFEDVYKIGREYVTWLITHVPFFFASARGAASLTSSRMASSLSSTFPGTCDAYAVLCMIRLVQVSQTRLHNEFHIPVLEDHLNSLLLILWPHFTRIIDLNCDSMKKLATRSTRTEASLAPIAMTQQFGQLLVGLLKLCVDHSEEAELEAFEGEPLATCITRLRNDFETTLTKLSNRSFNKKTTDKEIFLYNNYFLVANILKNEIEKTNTLVQEQIDHFEMLYSAYKK